MQWSDTSEMMTLNRGDSLNAASGSALMRFDPQLVEGTGTLSPHVTTMVHNPLARVFRTRTVESAFRDQTGLLCV